MRAAVPVMAVRVFFPVMGVGVRCRVRVLSMSFGMEVSLLLGHSAAEIAIEGQHHHPHGVERGQHHARQEPDEGNYVDPVGKVAVAVEGGQ